MWNQNPEGAHVTFRTFIPRIAEVEGDAPRLNISAEEELAAAIIGQAFADLVEPAEDAYEFLTTTLWEDAPEGLPFLDIFPGLEAVKGRFLDLVESVRSGESRPPVLSRFDLGT